MKIYSLFLAVALVSACGSKSNFSGEGQQGAAAESKEAVPYKSGNVEPAPKPATKAPAIGVPDRAIKAGNFFAWTEPEDPAPFEEYDIFVKVVLQADQIASYTSSDIRGQVVGTDDFFVVFGGAITAGPNFKIQEDGALFKVPIPGGGLTVQDTINVSSIILKENQTIVLEF